MIRGASGVCSFLGSQRELVGSGRQAGSGRAWWDQGGKQSLQGPWQGLGEVVWVEEAL